MMNGEEIKEKVYKERKEIIEEFYNCKMPDNLNGHTIFSRFMTEGLIYPDYTALYEQSGLSGKITFEDFISILSKDREKSTASWIELIDALFLKLKNSTPSKGQSIADVSKGIKLLWLFMYYKWSEMEQYIVEKDHTAQLKFYIISYICIGIKTPLYKELGVPKRTTIQIRLLAYLKFKNPDASKSELEELSGINGGTIKDLIKSNEFQATLNNFTNMLDRDEPFVQRQIEELKRLL